ncbi:MAG: STAS-like domain-containing protein [Betaproteobacteria bacterium]|nr:STAS-like domain-containing protein [Betaproteobacteria bacterium]
MTPRTLSDTIVVAREFSDTPAGRYPEDGDFSGQRFRKDYLVPALKKFQIVTVDLDGMEGYGSSFLEEAFGGLVREEGFAPKELHERLKLKSLEDESVIPEIWEYIDEPSK